MKQFSYRLITPLITIGLSLILLWVLAPTPTAHAQDFTVTKTDDTADGTCDGDCSLREAIIAANENPGPDTIILGPGTYSVSIGGRSEDQGLTGDLDIRSDITLLGSGADKTIIDASGFPSSETDRVLHIVQVSDPFQDPPVVITPTVVITGITITGGDVSQQYPGLGGGIDSSGTLTLRNSKISSNTSRNGGGLYQATTAPLTIQNSVFSNNLAFAAGGAIGTGNNAQVTIVDTVIEENITRGDSYVKGGGVYGMGHITLVGTTIRNNRLDRLKGTSGGCGVGEGGGIYLFYGLLTVQDSLIVGNSIESEEPGCTMPTGGGIYHRGVGGGPESEGLVLINTQVLSNTAGAAGGILFSSGTLGGESRIEDSLIAYNYAESFQPDTNFDGMAGGLWIQSGPFTITNSTIAHNRADADGGGIVSSSSVRIENSLIANNHAGSKGGGGFGSFEMIRSIVRDNTAAQGAGLALSDSEIEGSVISHNLATDEGGGLYEPYAFRGGPVINIRNSTISGNIAGRAAAISHTAVSSSGRFEGEMYLVNTTIAANRAISEVAGILYEAGLLELTNVLLSDNDGDNCRSGIATGNYSKGHNLSDDGTCLFTSAGDQVKVDVKLGPLQDNGGPTLTHALLDGSPAIDTGDDTVCPATDQRGITRPRGPHCDIGAYEYVVNKPILKASPSELAFIGVAGSASPVDQIIQVLNDGTDSFTWTVAESIPWLSLSTTSGNPPADVTVFIDSSGLGVGSYTGDVTFSATGALASPQTVKTTLQIIDAADLLKNGTFEGGRTVWSESSSQGRALIRQGGDVPHTSPHSGSWAVVLGQVDGETSELSQQVTLPTGGDLRLRYYSYAHSTETNCTFEIAEVWIGQTKVKEHPLCQSQNSSGWTQDTIDLNAYRGQTLTLRFKLRNDVLSDPSTFLVDDVSLELNVAAPTVTSNFAAGAPSSYFTIRAENFPPNTQATILLNGHQVGTGQTDDKGVLQVELNTAGADEGIYVVTVHVNLAATYVLRLDASAPARSKQDSGAMLAVPSGIALTPRVYLPGVSR